MRALLDFVLGRNSETPAGQFSADDFTSALRDGLIVAASTGAVILLETLNAVDYGALEALTAALIGSALAAVRRWAKDNSSV